VGVQQFGLLAAAPRVTVLRGAHLHIRPPAKEHQLSARTSKLMRGARGVIGAALESCGMRGERSVKSTIRERETALFFEANIQFERAAQTICIKVCTRTQAQTPGNLTYLLGAPRARVKQLSAGNFLSAGQDVQSTCARSQFSAAHKRSVDERGGLGKS
jgi:hypothetical protein